MSRTLDPAHQTTPGSETAEPAADKLMYTCPVHSKVQQDHPGACPECGMALEPKTAPAKAGDQDDSALSEAEVGIAMGTGTDVAMQSAGITLMRGDLRGIAQAIRLSRATMRNIRQNLVFAFLYNALGIPVAAGVLYPFFGLLLSPVIAGAAMSLSSVSVISNALRLRTIKL